jgi:hypothetical protein
MAAKEAAHAESAEKTPHGFEQRRLATQQIGAIKQQ